MIATLNRLHAELADAMSALALLTDGPRPDPSILAEHRLAVVRASCARSRFLDQEVYPFLLAAMPADAAAPVADLQAEAIALRLVSSRHVSTWTLGEAMREWDAYTAASRALRADMRRRIAEEQAVLEPLLAAATPTANAA